MGMSDILAKIVATTVQTVLDSQSAVPLEELKEKLEDAPPVRPFLPETDNRPVSIIAEVKRASPSKGDIRVDLNPATLAKDYEAGGAAALSVLTDTPFFKGSGLDLVRARSAVTLPVLRKDFIIDDYQIYEARVWGADAVLLIARILSAQKLSELYATVNNLGMEALVEIHDERDLETITLVRPRLVGINNRNLQTFDTDTGVALRMAEKLAPGQVPVAASGIAGPEDIRRNLDSGIRHFLIGESAVRAEDPAAFLNELIEEGN